MNIGILGAGNIAGTMAKTLGRMEGVTPYAAAAREHGRAKAFADTYGIQKAYGSYRELLEDPEVTLVYIATPHSHHYGQVKDCLLHGKHVLCEKAFTANAAEAKEVLTLAEEKGLLLTEAIWTRYMPMRKKLDELIGSGIIGTVHSLSANLGYVISDRPRLRDPALAGGALLDVGVYPLNFAVMAFGNEIERVSSSCVKLETGVDAQNQVTLDYRDGKTAVLHSSMLCVTDRRGIISGDKGFIEVKNINNCEGITVYDKSYQPVASYERPEQISGYEYEVEAAVSAIREGRVECPEMPHAETLFMMELCDGLRREWGIRFPFEA